MGKSVTITTDVEVYLDDLDDDDLVEELKARGFTVAPDGPPAATLGADHPSAVWLDLSRDIAAAARSGDLVHLGVLMVRMLELAGVPHPQIGVPGPLMVAAHG